MKIRVVTSEEEFLGMGARWNDLVSRAADANTFLTFEWLSSWWIAYRPEAKLFLIVAEDDAGRLQGIAPLVLKSVRKLGVSFRAVFFLGDGTYETDHMNFIVTREGRESVLRDLLAALDRERGWDVAHFNQIPAESANGKDLLAWIGARGYIRSVLSLPCPVRDFPETFDALVATMQSRFRTTIRSTRKKLEAKYRVEFGLHNEPAELPEALEALYRNHASRWSAKAQSGVFVNERRREFYRRLSEALHTRGALRFFYLKLDGKIVAQEYCFEHDGVVYLLQEGFDYAYANENVGHMLRSKIFERLIGEKARRYDFLEGTSRHKLIWSQGTVYDLRVTACRPGWKAVVYHYAPRVAAKVRSAIARLLSAWAKRKPDGTPVPAQEEA